MTPTALLTPARFATAFLPGFQFPGHVAAFQRATMRLLTDTTVNRQVVEAPVRHGKSWWHSVIVPAWHCCAFPDKRVLGVSYGASLSDTFSRDVVRLVTKAAPYCGLALDPKWTRVDSFRWSDHGGGYDSCGAQGAVSGKGYHYIAADDLVKDDEEARSPVMRAALSKWFFADLLTRLEPGAKVSLVMSRRHMADLSGECLALNAELPEAHKWHSVKFKAIGDDGAALWPARFPLDKLRDIQREFELAGRSYMFSSLYQQDPRSDPESAEWPDDYFSGDMFYEELPPDLPVRLKVIACDPSKGSRSKSGDYCAIAKIVLSAGHPATLWVDCQLRRMTIPDVTRSFAAEIAEWKPHAAIQETQGFQEALALDVRRLLDERGAHCDLRYFDSSDDKLVRIRTSLSEWLHLRRFRVKNNVGGRLLVNQLKEFPSGEHDDGPDAVAMGLGLIWDILA